MALSLAERRLRYPRSYDELGIYIPQVPCALYGLLLFWTECAPVAGNGVLGHGHKPGRCDPKPWPLGRPPSPGRMTDESGDLRAVA